MRRCVARGAGVLVLLAAPIFSACGEDAVARAYKHALWEVEEDPSLLTDGGTRGDVQRMLGPPMRRSDFADSWVTAGVSGPPYVEEWEYELFCFIDCEGLVIRFDEAGRVVQVFRIQH